MLIIAGLVVVAGAVAFAEIFGKSKSDFALNGLWIWLAASAANLAYEVLLLGHSVASALGTFVGIFLIPAIIAVFLWRFFRLV